MPQAMLLQLSIIALVLLAASLAFARSSESSLEEQYGLRAKSVAESVAEVPEIRRLVGSGAISPRVQEIAESVRLRTGVSFVVVTDVRGVRHSHPRTERIGQTVSTDPSRPLAGISDWYVETGTLGPSVRGKVPIWDVTGERVIGIVSVGIVTGELSATVRHRVEGVLLAASGVFAIGVLAAYVAARMIRRQTLGLEPPEIASLYEHRDGMLRALNEGVLAIDRAGAVTLVNDEAADMLGLDRKSVGLPLPGRSDLKTLRTLATTAGSLRDVPLQIGSRALLLTAAPITIRGRPQGAVFTFRDRTELHGLVSELESAQSLVDALRAQAHEHSNDLHTIAGLIELGRLDEVLAVVADHSESERALADLYHDRSGGNPLVVAALLAKAAIAAERHIRLRTHVGELPHTEVAVSRDLVTIIGNLVDNAIDHLSERPGSGGEIEVGVWHDDGTIGIDVSDSGEGIAQPELDRIFESGYTTKNGQRHEGLGLALVGDLVNRYRGQIEVDSEVGSGTLFSVRLSLHSKGELVDV